MAAPKPRRSPVAALATWAALSALALTAAAGSGSEMRPDPERPAGSAPAPADPGHKDPDAYERALALYRQSRFDEAAAILEASLASGTAGRGYRSLLGWCDARRGRWPQAATTFREALGEDPSSSEARQGLALALLNTGASEEALDLILPLVRQDPNDSDVQAIAARALATKGMVKDRRLEETSADGAGAPSASGAHARRVVARAGARFLEPRWGERFVPIFVKGVNLGVALPGRFPAEFPEEAETYRTWLDQIADLGANAVRLYTLLPPAFYRALWEHDTKILAGAPASRTPPRGFLWLIQGVWTELPDEDRYDDPAFEGSFRAEMERAVDVLHGNIAVARRPGHAFGVYRHDVSGMTLAFILGREWEPYSVEAYDAAHPMRRFTGRWFTLAEGTAMEAWLAAQMDHVTGYEAVRYATAHPVAFTNWPTLDPLSHPTEATKAEEKAIAEKKGLPFEARAVHEYDNDAVGIDANRIHPTKEAPAGQFASYHAYPYYPDFMNVDPNYLEARDRYGRDNYAGYLRDLRAHHADLPVIISEVGVPTSRGVSHVQPQGFDHGGHNETGQGEIDARLVEAIHDEGCGGAVVFAWIDEWFKRNWLVMDFERPYERNPKWLNALDPEQNYGLLAARPGARGPAIVLDGKGEDWVGATLLARAPQSPGPPGGGRAPRLRALWAAHDEAYLYLRLDVDGLDRDGDGEIDPDAPRLDVGIDTYGAEEGDHRFPGGSLEAPTGMEFMLEIAGRDSSRLLVDTPYDLFTHRYDRPYRSVRNDDGRYVEIHVETNRRRIGRDGTLYPAVIHDRSALRYGTTDPNAPEYDSLADWFADPRTGILEIRLPWGLLNVADPSSRRVVEDPPAWTDEVGTRATDGFRFYAAAIDARDGEVLDTLPAREGASRIAAGPSTLYSWKGWEEPTYHMRLKRSYFILRDRWNAIPDPAAP